MCEAGVVRPGVDGISIEGEDEWLDEVVLVARLWGHLLRLEEA